MFYSGDGKLVIEIGDIIETLGGEKGEIYYTHKHKIRITKINGIKTTISHNEIKFVYGKLEPLSIGDKYILTEQGLDYLPEENLQKGQYFLEITDVKDTHGFYEGLIFKKHGSKFTSSFYFYFDDSMVKPYITH